MDEPSHLVESLRTTAEQHDDEHAPLVANAGKDVCDWLAVVLEPFMTARLESSFQCAALRSGRCSGYFHVL